MLCFVPSHILLFQDFESRVIFQTFVISCVAFCFARTLHMAMQWCVRDWFVTSNCILLSLMAPMLFAASKSLRRASFSTLFWLTSGNWDSLAHLYWKGPEGSWMYRLWATEAVVVLEVIAPALLVADTTFQAERQLSVRSYQAWLKHQHCFAVRASRSLLHASNELSIAQNVWPWFHSWNSKSVFQ